MINGGTGPVLAFTEILYKISQSMDVPFLTLNAWIGIWVTFYMVVAAVVDLNRVIILCTRFTDEIFSFLVSIWCLISYLLVSSYFKISLLNCPIILDCIDFHYQCHW